ELTDQRGPSVGTEVIDLRDVVPWREIGIAAARDEPHPARWRLHDSGRALVATEGVLRNVDVAVRTGRNPRVIERGVVDNEVDDQPHAAGVTFLTDCVDIIPRSDRFVRLVRSDGKRRT